MEESHNVPQSQGSDSRSTTWGKQGSVTGEFHRSGTRRRVPEILMSMFRSGSREGDESAKNGQTSAAIHLPSTETDTADISTAPSPSLENLANTGEVTVLGSVEPKMRSPGDIDKPEQASATTQQSLNDTDIPGVPALPTAPACDIKVEPAATDMLQAPGCASTRPEDSIPIVPKYTDEVKEARRGSGAADKSASWWPEYPLMGIVGDTLQRRQAADEAAGAPVKEAGNQDPQATVTDTSQMPPETEGQQILGDASAEGDGGTSEKTGITEPPARADLTSTERDAKNKAPEVTSQIQFEPSALIDGTKLILNIGAHQHFQVDNVLRVMFSSTPLRRVERSITYTTYTVDVAETIVVIDSCIANQTFVPVAPALYGGAIYTRESIAHVVVPGSADIKRSKVSAKSLPHKMCNKFVSQGMLQPQPQMLMPRNPRTATVRKPWSPLLANVPESAAAAGLVFIRVDSSVFRFPVKPVPLQILSTPTPSESACGTAQGTTGPSAAVSAAESPTAASNQLGSVQVAAVPSLPVSCEFHDGRVVAWSGGVEFKFQTTMWCCKKVSGANVANGTVWIDNPKQTPSQPQPFAA